MILEIETQEAKKVLNDINELYKKFTLRKRNNNLKQEPSDKLSPGVDGRLSKKEIIQMNVFFNIFVSHSQGSQRIIYEAKTGFGSKSEKDRYHRCIALLRKLQNCLICYEYDSTKQFNIVFAFLMKFMPHLGYRLRESLIEKFADAILTGNFTTEV